MTETHLNTILIVTDDDSQIPERDRAKTGSDVEENWGKGFGGVETSGSKGLRQTIELSSSVLEEKMKKFIGTMGKIFENIDVKTDKEDGMYLDEVELSIEIGAKGEIKLIGNGISSENKTAIKLKFKRNK